MATASQPQTILVQSPLHTQPICMFCLSTVDIHDSLLTKEGCPCVIFFHTHCIQTWIQMYEDHPCPLCRKSVTFIDTSSIQRATSLIRFCLIICLLIVMIISYSIYMK